MLIDLNNFQSKTKYGKEEVCEFLRKAGVILVVKYVKGLRVRYSKDGKIDDYLVLIDEIVEELVKMSDLLESSFRQQSLLD